MLNQILLWDDLQLGLKPRWSASSDATERDINRLLAEALTPAP